MSQDEEQLRLLAIFHYVCAGLAALLACIPIIHLVLGLVMLLNPHAFGGRDQPPAVIGWFFVIIATMMICLGWIFAALVAFAGRCLAQRRHYIFCLAMGGVECLFMPFGTVLGVFTIIVLMRPTVKFLFSGGPPPASV